MMSISTQLDVCMDVNFVSKWSCVWQQLFADTSKTLIMSAKGSKQVSSLGGSNLLLETKREEVNGCLATNKGPELPSLYMRDSTLASDVARLILAQI